MDSKLDEIITMLKKICAYIDKVESPEYKQQEYNIQFLLNLGADALVELLEKFKRNETGRS